MNFHSIYEVYNLFKDFKIVCFFEERTITQTMFQGEQFWHEYNIIAIKKAVSPERLFTNLDQAVRPKDQQEDVCVTMLDSIHNKNILYVFYNTPPNSAHTYSVDHAHNCESDNTKYPCSKL